MYKLPFFGLFSLKNAAILQPLWSFGITARLLPDIGSLIHLTVSLCVFLYTLFSPPPHSFSQKSTLKKKTNPEGSTNSSFWETFISPPKLVRTMQSKLLLGQAGPTEPTRTDKEKEDLSLTQRHARTHVLSLLWRETMRSSFHCAVNTGTSIKL